VRIDEWKAQPERVTKPLFPARKALLAETLEDAGRVGRDVAVQEVVRVQLREQLDYLVLRGQVGAARRAGLLPESLNRLPAVHAAHEAVRARRHAVITAARRVVHDVPELAAVVVAVKSRVRQ